MVNTDPGVDRPIARAVVSINQEVSTMKLRLVAIASGLMALFHTAGAVWRW